MIHPGTCMPPHRTTRTREIPGQILYKLKPMAVALMILLGGPVKFHWVPKILIWVSLQSVKLQNFLPSTVCSQRVNVRKSRAILLTSGDLILCFLKLIRQQADP